MTTLHARRRILTLRLRTLRDGHDPAGAFLLAHHALWLLVLLLPGDTLPPPYRTDGTRNSTALFAEHGGDLALATLYAVLLAAAATGVLRLSVRTDVQRGCLLAVLAVSAGLATTYLWGNVNTVGAWDALLRALLAWWAYTALDRDD